jgi:elongation factor G
VEAQTLTVWDQATRYNLPSLAFLNKMDKEAANVQSCLDSIEKRLDVHPVLLQAPCGVGKSFHGGLVV